MKNRTLLLDISIIALTIIFALFIFYFRKEIGSKEFTTTYFSIGGFIGGVVGFAVNYWTTKKAIIETQQINGKRAIQTWQYLMITFLLASMIIFSLYIFHIIQSPKFMMIFFLAWIGIVGNFRATIEPNFETVSVYMDDIDVSKKTKRFSGKFSVIISLLSIFLVIVVPKFLAFYILIITFILSIIIPLFYAKYTHKQKFA